MVKKFQGRNIKGQFLEAPPTPQVAPQSMHDIPKVDGPAEVHTVNPVFEDSKNTFEFDSLSVKEVKNYLRAMNFASQEVATPASKAAVLLQRTIIEERFGAINWAA